MRSSISDDVKAALEGSDSAAGERPRRDSAQAAALTVGAPSDVIRESATRAPRDALGISTRVGIAARAVVSSLLIGISAFAIAGGFGLSSESPIAKAAQSVGMLQEPAAEGDSSEVAASRSDSSSEGGQQGEADASSRSASGSDGPSGDMGAAGGASGGGSATGSGSSDSGEAASGGSSAQQGSGSSSDSSSQGSSESHDGVVPGTIAVSVSISSSAVGNPVSGGGSFTFNRGATPYDALCACGLSVNASQTQYGIYVSAIGGLAEKEHGGQSGWMYSVNGSVPMTACSNYKLSDGDAVSWYYVTSD